MRSVKKYLFILFFVFLSTSVKADPLLNFNPLKQEVKSGQELVFKIEVEKVEDLFSSPFYLIYDPKILEFLRMDEGEFLKKDGKQTIFMKSVKGGEIVVGLSRLGPVGGVSGSGVILGVKFKAIHKGKTVLKIIKTDFMSSKLLPVKIETNNAEIIVK